MVLVVGRPAAGKSTIARAVAAAFGLPLVAKDDLKEILFESLGTGDRAWSKRLGVAAFDLLDRVIDLQLAGGGSFVVDSAFDAALAGPAFVARAEQFDARWVQVHCTAPRDVLVRRFADRAASGTRHAGHVDEGNVDEFAAGLDVPRAETFELPGPVLRVDTSVEGPAAVLGRLRPLLGLDPGSQEPTPSRSSGVRN